LMEEKDVEHAKMSDKKQDVESTFHAPNIKPRWHLINS
jgi:hypothetical protein